MSNQTWFGKKLETKPSNKKKIENREEPLCVQLIKARSSQIPKMRIYRCMETTPRCGILYSIFNCTEVVKCPSLNCSGDSSIVISTELRIWKIETEFFSLWDLQTIFRGLPNVIPNFTSPDIKIWDMGNVRGILSLKSFLPSLTNFHVKRSLWTLWKLDLHLNIFARSQKKNSWKFGLNTSKYRCMRAIPKSGLYISCSILLRHWFQQNGGYGKIHIEFEGCSQLYFEVLQTEYHFVLEDLKTWNP